MSASASASQGPTSSGLRKPHVAIPDGFTPAKGQTKVTLDLETAYNNLCTLGADRSARTRCGIWLGKILHGIHTHTGAWEHPFVVVAANGDKEQFVVSQYPLRVEANGETAEGEYHVVLRFRARLFESLKIGRPTKVLPGNEFRLSDGRLASTAAVEIFAPNHGADFEVPKMKHKPAFRPATQQSEMAVAA